MTKSHKKKCDESEGRESGWRRESEKERERERRVGGGEKERKIRSKC